MTYPAVDSCLTRAVSTASADWLKLRTDNVTGLVASHIPRNFAAYARILHPAILESESIEIQVPWREIASARGIRPHHRMQWPEVSGDNEWGTGASDRPDIWTQAPATGTLTPQIAEHLGTVLQRSTDTPGNGSFAVWGGFGYIDAGVRFAPIFTLAERDLHLFQGPLEGISITFASQPEIYQSANLWWPEDQAWCVATDIDLMSTYIGGGSDTIASILGDPELEALQVFPSDRVTLR